MQHNFNHQSDIKNPDTTPTLKHIPPGKFIDIDEKYYSNNHADNNHQPEVFGMNGPSLKPYGQNANYNPTPLIEKAGGLTSDLKVNYGSYIYNQITGWDANHPN